MLSDIRFGAPIILSAFFKGYMTDETEEHASSVSEEYHQSHNILISAYKILLV